MRPLCIPRPRVRRSITAYLVVIATLFGWLLAGPTPPARAAITYYTPTSDDVLFIHGINGGAANGSPDTNAGGCVRTWNNAEATFNELGWTGARKTVGYYTGDWKGTDESGIIQNHCDVQFDSKAPLTPVSYYYHQRACDGYYFNSNTEGTNNQDLRNIACQLAWYIFTNYTVHNRNVFIVAHSMGGLITRWALDQVQKQNSTFPPYLYVPGVVTFETPHGGIIDPAGSFFVCGACTMGTNMQPIQPDTNSEPSRMINELKLEPFAPIGSPGEPTQWTLFGDYHDSFLKLGVPPDVALDVPPGGIGYPAVHKIEYFNVPGLPGNQYDHGGYLYDDSRNQDATAWTCDNCTGTPPASNVSVYHSLREAYIQLSHPIPTPPAYPVVNVQSGGLFFDAWDRVTGVYGGLQDPTSNWFAVFGGQQQNFQNGALYYSPDTGTNAVQGAINAAYTSTMGGPSGKLGFPITDEQPTPAAASGRVSYFPKLLCGGGVVVGGALPSGSAIFWSPGTGAHEVQGCIYNKYMDIGGAAFGFPVTDEQDIAGGKVSYLAGQVCDGGINVGGSATSGSAIFYNGPAYEVQGCIYHDYMATMGGPGGTLGFPTSDEGNFNGGKESHFAGTSCTSGPDQGSGSAYFWTGATGAHEVQGCIYQTYTKHWTTTLGFPTSNEQSATGGKFNTFAGTSCTSGPYQGSGSAIYWNSAARQAYEVQGCIYRTYNQHLSGPGGVLGQPTSDEQSATGGKFNTFAGTNCTSGPYQGSGSAIYWNSAAGAAFEVQGCIYRTYVQHMGGPGGTLGQPTSDELTVTGGKANTFAGTNCTSGPYQGSGSTILWNSAAGAAYEVQGCIYQTYVQHMGGPGGTLGMLTSDEQGVTGGRVNTFAGTSCTVGSWQGSGSALYWNSAAGAAYEVQGCIYQRYVQNMGGPGGALGQPVSDEQAIGTNGDRVNYFTKGYIGWIKATGQTTVVFYPTS